MDKIIYRDLTNGNVETCRQLCNELMKFQTDMSQKYKNELSKMNFDNRLKPAFDSANEKFLYVAFCDDNPVEYIFCEAFIITEEIKNFKFDWINLSDNAKGLYPDDLIIPVKVAHLNNIYVKQTFRGKNIGKKLMNEGMNWLKNVPEAKYIFVHVSNGNNAGKLYEKYGFKYSHSVFEGMIDAYMMKI